MLRITGDAIITVDSKIAIHDSRSGLHASDSHRHEDGEVHHPPVTDPDTQSNVITRAL